MARPPATRDPGSLVAYAPMTSEPASLPPHPRPWRRPLLPRDPGEHERAATPLELFFDLCFVVAIALAASNLHHGIAEGHLLGSVVAYGQVFVAIWWAWMSFTWFASAYDNDDAPYRLLVFVQMTGVLLLAAGVPRAFHGDFTVVTIGYVILRIGMVLLWIRAAHADPPRRRTAWRYVGGISILQLAWIAILFLPASWSLSAWGILIACELLVPVWAERAEPTTWHPHHIAERYGLLTIIVLGESVLAATLALQAILDAGEITPALVRGIVGGLLILFSMWWLYFNEQSHRILRSMKMAFAWGYGHLFIFAATAAVGAGLAIYADVATHHAHISTRIAGASVAIPVSLFVLCVWLLLVRPARRGPLCDGANLLTVALVLATPFTPWPITLTGACMVLLSAVSTYTQSHRSSG